MAIIAGGPAGMPAGGAGGMAGCNGASVACALAPRRSVAAAVIAVSVAAFGLLALNISDGDALASLDATIVTWFRAHATPALTTFMLGVTQLNGTAGILAMTVAFAAYLSWKKHGTWVAFVTTAVPGAMLLNSLVKYAFQRARPQFADPGLFMSSWSFPSGHAVFSTVFYGIFAAFVTTRVRPATRPWVWLAAAAMVVLICTTRLYLGVHYLTDAIAGVLEGIAWVACCYLVASAWRSRRHASRERAARY